MNRMFSAIRDLTKDALVGRLIIGIFGLALASIGTTLLLSGIRNTGLDVDSSLWLSLLLAIGVACMMMGIFGSENSISKAAAWIPGEVAVLIGLVFLAIPLALLIRSIYPRHVEPRL